MKPVFALAAGATRQATGAHVSDLRRNGYTHSSFSVCFAAVLVCSFGVHSSNMLTSFGALKLIRPLLYIHTAWLASESFWYALDLLLGVAVLG